MVGTPERSATAHVIILPCRAGPFLQRNLHSSCWRVWYTLKVHPTPERTHHPLWEGLPENKESVKSGMKRIQMMEFQKCVLSVVCAKPMLLSSTLHLLLVRFQTSSWMHFSSMKSKPPLCKTCQFLPWSGTFLKLFLWLMTTVLLPTYGRP